MTSQNIIVQSSDGGSFTDRATLSPASPNTTSPNPVSCIKIDVNGDDQLRLWQPANNGPETYPVIFWVAEILVQLGDRCAPESISTVGSQ